jgi:hypothetical protein
MLVAGRVGIELASLVLSFLLLSLLPLPLLLLQLLILFLLATAIIPRLPLVEGASMSKELLVQLQTELGALLRGGDDGGDGRVTNRA